MHYENLRFKNGALFLVTGGAGFIGSNLCEAILRMGYRVRCLDNLSTGKQEHVNMFLGNPNYEFMFGDIRNYDICLKACENVDFVLHQAAWGSVPRSIELPLEYEEINIRGTLNMFEAARKCKVEKMVFASSSSVYGDDPILPKKEGKEGHCLSPYALTKMVNEEYGWIYKHVYNLDTYGLRYFNVFGKRQDPEGIYAAVIPKFIKQLLNNQTPYIFGDGTQSRDFTYIENVIEANIVACKAPRESAGESYNIAFGERESLNEIYNFLCKALNKNITPIYGPNRIGDIQHSNADIHKAKTMLGYNPEWSFEKGIVEALDWYKENL